MNDKSIAVIIVSFGRCVLLKQTLSSLFATRNQGRASITVIDNGSQLPVVEALTLNKDRIDNLILLNENRGKPYAWNLGVKIVNERCLAINRHMPDYYLFCDSDLLFKDNWLDCLLETYEIHRDLPLGILSGYNHLKHNHNIISNSLYPNHDIDLIPFPAGCCMFMHRSVYEKTGSFDDSKLIRTVDTAYYRRAREAGFVNAAVYPNSVIEHTGWKERTWHIGTGQPKLLK